MAQATPVKISAPKQQPAVERPSQFQERRSDQSGRYDNLLALQRAAGNHAISQALQSSIKSPAPNGDGIPPIVRSVINRGGGQPLDPSIRADMESRFGQDFSQVRVHTDTRAADSAEAVSAKAYTVGRDVVFGEGRYAPDTSEGKRVLAHELAHVVQQSRGGAAPALNPGSPLEQAADQTAGVIHGSGVVEVAGASAPGLARQPAAADEPDRRSDSEIVKELEARTGKKVSELILSLGRGPIDISPRDIEAQLYANKTLRQIRQKQNDRKQVVIDEVLERHPYNPDRFITVARIGTEEDIAQLKEAGQQAAIEHIKGGLIAAGGARVGGASEGLVRPVSQFGPGPKPPSKPAGAVAPTPPAAKPANAPTPITASKPPPKPAGAANDNAVFPKVPQSFQGGASANDVLPQSTPLAVAAGQDFSPSGVSNQPKVGAAPPKGNQFVASANQGDGGNQPSVTKLPPRPVPSEPTARPRERTKPPSKPAGAVAPIPPAARPANAPTPITASKPPAVFTRRPAFAEHRKYREDLKLPPAGSLDDPATIARFVHSSGEEFIGINAHGQTGSLRINAISKTHAEGDVFIQAQKKGISGGDGTLYVDRALCVPCENAVLSVARQLGLQRLKIVEPDSVSIIRDLSPRKKGRK